MQLKLGLGLVQMSSDEGTTHCDQVISPEVRPPLAHQPKLGKGTPGHSLPVGAIATANPGGNPFVDLFLQGQCNSFQRQHGGTSMYICSSILLCFSLNLFSTIQIPIISIVDFHIILDFCVQIYNKCLHCWFLSQNRPVLLKENSVLASKILLQNLLLSWLWKMTRFL